ncbi:MAG: hypothetical protein RIC55_06230 [Pirellulaceae bacterium]
MKNTILLAAAAVCLLLSVSATAAEWGDLKGRFVFDGTPPAPAPVTVTKDVEFCGKHKLVNEEIVVGKDGGIKNIVVLLYLDRSDTAPAAHESYAKTADAKVKLDNKNCRFEPHVTLLRTSQTLVVGNSDPVGHNSKFNTFANPPINPIIPAGSEIEQQFTTPERFPVGVSCSIHPWMNSWVYIADHPYMAVTDASGNFEIKNLPAGEWTFQIRHDTGYVQDVKVDGKAQNWSKGRIEVSIEPERVTDLGEVRFAPKP